MREVLKRLARVTLLALATACGGADADAGYAAVDSAGVTLATNVVAEAPVFARLSTSPELRLGSEHDPATIFHRVVSVASLGEDRMVVGDAGSRDARVFAADGRHLLTVGGEGGGPGEVRELMWAKPVRGGEEILLWDMGSMRGQRFASDGTLVGATPILGSPDHPLYFATGTRGDELIAMGGPPPLRLDPDGRLWQWTDYLLFSFEGELLDTIGSFRTLECHPQNRAVCMHAPQYAGATHAWSDERFFQVIVDRPQLEVFDFEGRLLTRARLRLSRDAGANGDEASGEEREASSSPAILDQVLADAAGRAWIRRAGTGTWYVLEPETGRLLGTVSLPPSLRPMEIGEEYLLGIERDSLDVPTVVRYGVEVCVGGGSRTRQRHCPTHSSRPATGRSPPSPRVSSTTDQPPSPPLIRTL